MYGTHGTNGRLFVLYESHESHECLCTELTETTECPFFNEHRLTRNYTEAFELTETTRMLLCAELTETYYTTFIAFGYYPNNISKGNKKKKLAVL